MSVELPEQVEEVEGEDEENDEVDTDTVRLESSIHISPCLKEGEKWEGVVYENKYTMTSTLEHAVKLFPSNQVYGVRTSDKGDFEFLTYESLWEILKIIAKGLKSELTKSEPQTRIGIILETSREWSLLQHSSYLLNFVVVGIATNTGPFSMIKVINENEMEVLAIHFNMLETLEEIARACPSLKKVIVVGIPAEKVEKERKKDLFDIIPFERLLTKYKFDYEDFEIVYPHPDSICLQIYTSGSTGEAKGVLLSHRNTVQTVAALIDNNENYDFRADLNYVSFLPLSHLNEQTGHHVFLFLGSKIGFGTLQTLMSREDDGFVGDLEVINPIIFSGVPRVWETLRKAIEYKVSNYSWFWKWVFHSFLDKRITSLKAGRNEEFYFEKYVFGKIRRMFGNGIEILVSGSSALASETQYFIQAIMGSKIIFSNAYGLSETVSGVAIQNIRKFAGVNNVGHILKGNEVKLVSCPDLNYLTHDPETGEEKEEPEGEIWVRTPQLFQGYYRKPEITAQSMAEGGWYKSGDVGRFLKDEGKLSIIDRIKNVLKIGNGEFVAVEAMESRYNTSSFIRPNGICVIPNGYKSYICAIALIDPKYTLQYINNNLVPEGEEKMEDVNEALKKYSDDVKKQVIADLERIGKVHKRPYYEYIRDLALYNDEWNPLNGLTSMAYKLFRRKIAKKYKSDLDRMYKNEGENSKGDGEDDNNTELERLEVIKLFPGIEEPNLEIVLKLCKMMDRSVRDIDFSKPIQSTGIDSLTTVLLLNTLKKTTGKSVRVSLLATRPLGSILGKLFVENWKKKFGNEEETEGENDDDEMFEDYEEFVNLEKEFVKLEEEVLPQIHKHIDDHPEQQQQLDDKKPISGIFVTGASGFLGIQLIIELLSQFDQSVKLYCLIRSQSVDRFLSKFPNNKNKNRIIVIEGDLSEPFFGFNSEEEMTSKILYNGELKNNNRRIQAILHGGSLVNHFFGYDDLYETNVSSFYDILRLSNLKIPIHLISSTVTYLNLPDRENVSLEEQLYKLKYPKILGYGASKFASDCLATKTNSLLSRNLVTIHRPSFIGPSRKNTEVFNSHDWFAVFVKEIIKHKLTCDSDYFVNPFDMVSVDYCAFLIINILKNKSSSSSSSSTEEEEEKDVNKTNFYEYSLKNNSLFEISKLLESMTDQKFALISDYREYIRVIRNNVQEELSLESSQKIPKKDLVEAKFILPFLNMMEQNPALLDQFKIAASAAGPNRNLVEYIEGCDDVELEKKYELDDLKVFLRSLWNSIHEDEKIL